LLHTKHGTEESFFKHYGLPKDYGIKEAKRLYEETLWLREHDDDLPF